MLGCIFGELSQNVPKIVSCDIESEAHGVRLGLFCLDSLVKNLAQLNCIKVT